MEKNQIIFLRIGALQTVLLGVYHFFIPFQFNWGQFLSKDTQTINWALYALNNYFSFNLIVVAIFLIHHLLYKKEHLNTIKTLSIIATLFWCFSAIYQIINPMPLPKSLYWLGYALPGLAFLNITIFFIPLKRLVKTKLI